ncbi:penicillin acylase family protein [Streptomyces sp. NPDC101209]|uniref:penicillin acylase family protein n=1 Tax=Streptomyces sp. NPDC101209 TaxID=3366129 RepID=UPI0037FD3724
MTNASETPTKYQLTELANDVEIIVDTWGVPHIYAKTASDAFIAQGFNAARERLFQMEMLRRRGLGRLSEIFGAAYVEQDRASRLFLFRGAIDAEWAAYGDGAREIITDFVAGVNAYISWVRANHQALPPEFVHYDFYPESWDPEDLLRVRTHGIFFNAEHEAARAHTLRNFGERVEELRQTREPADPLVVPDGIDLAKVEDEALQLYRLAFSPVTYPGQTTANMAQRSVDGSNNWIIAADRSKTGRPILANDPHRALTLPSLRYIVHLEAPGLSVIGAGEPNLPGISIGHNGRVAFGLTIWPADIEDLYVYELDPSNPRFYKYNGQWERIKVVPESIRIRDSNHAEVQLAFTRHGPVIASDPEHRFCIALRAAWLEPGMVPYLGSLAYRNASTIEEFLAALDHWGAPAVNQVVAAPSGEIAWQASAVVPKRPNWDGGLPVPGDGRYEWDGYARAGELPRVRNPESGWFASANEMNLPEDFQKNGPPVTYDWPSPGRYQRLAKWLHNTTKVGIAESLEMQSDALNVHAREAIDLLAPIDIAHAEQRTLFEALQDWDGVEGVDSIEAAVFEIWFRRHFRKMLAELHLRPHGFEGERLDGAIKVLLRDETFGGDLRAELRMLRAIDWRDEHVVDELSKIVNSSLEQASEELERLLGKDRNSWTWGRLHHAEFINPALDPIPGIPDRWKHVGPLPRSGSGDTVGAAAYDQNFRQTSGSSFRMVVDVGAWDSSLAMNSPGQSGDPRSPHYNDLFAPWARGEAFPMLYSRQAVLRHAEMTIRLRPASRR